MVTGACQHTSSKMCSRPNSEAPRVAQASCTAVALENACGVDSNMAYALKRMPPGCRASTSADEARPHRTRTQCWTSPAAMPSREGYNPTLTTH